jgi:hypothetical protein
MMLIKTDFNEVISIALTRNGYPKKIQSIDSYNDEIHVSIRINSLIGNHKVKLKYNSYSDSVLTFNVISGLGLSILANTIGSIISNLLPLGVWVERELLKINPNEILEDKNAQIWVNNIWMEGSSLFVEMAHAV